MNIKYKPEYNMVVYPDKIRLECIKYSLIEDYKGEVNKKIDNNDLPITDESEISRISLSRSRGHIFDIAYCNNFTHFVTITIDKNNADRYSFVECSDLLRKTMKRIKRKYKKFKYLICFEKHKDGAFHFHGLCSGLDLGEGLSMYQDHIYCDIVSDKMGFINSFLPIRLDLPDSYARVCSYITKYITKALEIREYKGAPVYWRSRDLNMPSRYICDQFSFNLDEFDFSNEFVSFKDFDNLTQSQKLDMIQYFNAKEK